MATENVNQRALDNECEKLAVFLTRHTDGQGDGSHPTAINKLEIRRESSVSTSLHNVCEPILVIIVQGKKTVLLGKKPIIMV